MTGFLRDAQAVAMEWPLAKDNRGHVHGEIDAHGLPVTHVTRREGRPYVLVLTKTEALFEQEAAQRRAWGAELRWLVRVARAFG